MPEQHDRVRPISAGQAVDHHAWGASPCDHHGELVPALDRERRP